MMGAPPEIIAARCDVDDFEVDYHNWTAFKVFQSCATQWRVIAYATGAHVQGIEYTSLESVMRMMRVKNPLKTFRKVQFIERGYLEKINEKR